MGDVIFRYEGCGVSQLNTQNTHTHTPHVTHMNANTAHGAP